MRSVAFLSLFCLVSPILAERVTATAHLNVRTGPGMGFSKVWVATPGTGFPLLKREGDWLKVQLIQYTPGDGAGFYVDTAAAAAKSGDTIEVAHLTAHGKKVSEEYLAKSALLPVRGARAVLLPGYFQVHIRRKGWIFAGYTQGPAAESTARNSDRLAPLKLPGPPPAKTTLNWASLRVATPLYLPAPLPRQMGVLDSGALVQILGEEGPYLKIQVASSDLKDTLYMDLNQFYDTNGGDTATLVLGTKDAIQPVGAVRKSQVQFDPNRAFFGPGISRLVPVALDLPLLVEAKAANRLTSYEDLTLALRGRKETHPGAFLSKDAASALVKLAGEGLDAVLAPKWFLENDSGHLVLGLTLKTLAAREAGRGPEEYFFHKYVRPVLEAYRPSLAALKPFQTLLVEVQYLEPGFSGAALRFKTLSYRLPSSVLVDLDQGKTTYRDVFHLAAAEHLGGAS